jgi:hypothetical protein
LYIDESELLDITQIDALLLLGRVEELAHQIIRKHEELDFDSEIVFSVVFFIGFLHERDLTKDDVSKLKILEKQFENDLIALEDITGLDFGNL